jgi:phosphoribosylformylglycinamidine synthase
MVNVLVLTGYGINCDEETKFAFESVGATADIVHINDLIDGKKKLSDYQVLTFPGGFSYGDDTGSGYALASKIRNHLWGELVDFVKGDNLSIGICNGFQVMVNLGLLPALEGKYGEVQTALVHNDSARYIDRWVDLEFNSKSPWTKDVGRISVPIAHGEGKFSVNGETLAKIKDKGLVAAKYVKGSICDYQNLEANPNGSIEDIASITDESGRLIGMMPHPERAIDVRQMPNWGLLKEQAKREGKTLTQTGPGLKIFRNAVDYFK